MTELKPCSKCGEPAQTFSNLKGTRWVTGCYKCHLWSRARTKDESREEWNRRVNEMSRIIVRFKKSADVSSRVQHAIIDICDIFGYCAPWFNDDVWFEDRDRDAIIIGSGYNVDNVDTRISIIKKLYGDCIKEIYEESDE